MRNLYVWFDERHSGDVRGDLRRLRDTAGYFREASVEPMEALFDELFPDGMPGRFLAANTSLDPERVVLTLRPAMGDGRAWAFPRGRSLCVRGSVAVRAADPTFLVQGVMEISDSDCRPFERELEVFTYRADPRARVRKSDNALTSELLSSLPRVSAATSARLSDWTEYLVWKRKLVREKSTGLRYVGRELRERSVVFRVLAPDEVTLDQLHRGLRREDVAAFDLKVSTDPWVLKVDERSKQRPQSFALGEARGFSKLAGRAASEGCPWDDARAAELEVDLSEDVQHRLQDADAPDEVVAAIEEALPVIGFVAVPFSGDLALVGRHERALRDLRDQGGYAPYLSAYLFDVQQANAPSEVPTVHAWHRDDLNVPQRRAVEKILAAPDLCLVQGPPGTGKTTVIAEATYQLVRAGKKVLLASQANTAVDNVLERLGHVPQIRAIRLGRAARFSGGGQEFAEDRVLGRFYGAIASECERVHLDRWAADTRTEGDLRDWVDRAGFAWADHERERKALDELRARTEWYDAATREAEAQLAAARAENERRAHQRAELGALVVLLDGGSTTPRVDALPPEADALIGILQPLVSTKVKGMATWHEWHAASSLGRQDLLREAILGWRRVHVSLAMLERDVERLRASGDGPLRDPSVAARLTALEREFAQVGAALEHDAGMLGRWQELAKERTSLRAAAGGLDRARYEELLHDGAELAAGLDASVALTRVEAVARVVTSLARSVAEGMSDLRARAVEDLDACAAVIVDESALRRCEADAKAHRFDVTQREIALAGRQRALDVLLEEAEALGLARVGAFPETIERARAELKAARTRVTDAKEERSTWERILRDWVADLRDPGTRRNDQARFIDAYLPNCNVVAVTCNENGRTLEDSRHTHFDVAIVDEVSKATATELLLPLMRARTAVLVGDHRQLPPLFSEAHEPIGWTEAVETDGDGASQESRTALTRENLRRFERLVTASLFKEHFEKAPDAIRERLEIQFRMHPQIMSLVNHFYEHRLTCGLRDPDAQRDHELEITAHDGRPLLTREHHAVWFDTSRDPTGERVFEDVDERGDSLRTNRLEAMLIAEALVRIDKASAAAGWSARKKRPVGVVSFYARQLRLIREEIRARTNGQWFECLDVEVNTVIRYQGKEKPIVLVSLVRNLHGRRSSRANVAQYQFINVAFSRAQELLLVFGAREMFQEYEVELPNMDATGSRRRAVYRDMLQELAREARLFTTERLMPRAEYLRRRGATARPGRRR